MASSNGWITTWGHSAAGCNAIASSNRPTIWGAATSTASSSGSGGFDARSGADEDGGSDLSHTIQLGGEIAGQPDASMRRRMARQVPAVERGAVLIDALHEGHRRILIFERPVKPLLLENREDSCRGRLTVLAAGNGRHGNKRASPIEEGKLVAETDYDACLTVALHLSP